MLRDTTLQRAVLPEDAGTTDRKNDMAAYGAKQQVLIAKLEEPPREFSSDHSDIKEGGEGSISGGRHDQ